MCFPFCEAVLSLQQSGRVSIPHRGWAVECCAAPALRDLSACLLVPGAKSEGDSPGLSSGAQRVPPGHSWTRISRHCLVSSQSPRRRGFLFPKLWCAHRFFHVNFLFSGKLIFSFFFNTIEFSKCKIIFWFSRQICCYLSRLSDTAEAFNKCLLLLMEIKLLGVSLARGIKN